MTRHYTREGTLLIRNSDIKDGRFQFEMEPIFLEESFARKNESRMHECGDIITVHTGDVGTSAVIGEKEQKSIGFATIVTRPDRNVIDSDYLCAFLNTDKHKKWAIAISTGDGRSNYNLKDYLSLIVPITLLREQKRIAIFIQNVNRLISLHQRKLEMLKKVKKLMLEKMFPKNDAKVPEVRFSDFTDAWEQCKFSDVVEIGSGMDYKHLGIGDIPVYGTGGYMLSVDVALSENNDAIGIGRKGTIDKPYILRAPFWTVDTLFYCIPKYNHNLDFTNCLFQNIDWKNKDESTGVPSLSKVIINNIETSIPSYEEQKKIGEYFKSFDNLIILHQRKYFSIVMLNTIIQIIEIICLCCFSLFYGVDYNCELPIT